MVEVHASWIARCPQRIFEFHHYRPSDGGSCRCYPERAAARNLAAEQRAVEEGHRAFVQTDGSIMVVSDSYDGKRYRVTFADAGGGIRFDCKPEGRMAYRDDHLGLATEPGIASCKHAAVAARRLEREGLAEFTLAGIWRSLTPRPEIDLPDNPLTGLPQ